MSLCKDNVSKNGKLAHVIELRIRIDNEDFMHNTNQYKFKTDGQDKGRGPRGVFQEATQATAWGAKKLIWVKGQRSQSPGELYVEECHYLIEEGDL